jgi:multiple sugar transport system ATP-binding protein
VAVLHMGRLQQCDTPQVLYDRPDNIFVAAFIGSPAMNLYEAALSADADQLKLGAQSINLTPEVLARRPKLGSYRAKTVVLGVRPEHLSDAALLGSAPAPGTTLSVDVELIEALGNELQVHFLIDAVRAESQETKAATETEELAGLPIQGGGTKTTGVARISPRSVLHAGARAVLYVDTDQLHFFDPTTGSAIWT